MSGVVVNSETLSVERCDECKTFRDDHAARRFVRVTEALREQVRVTIKAMRGR